MDFLISFFLIFPFLAAPSSSRPSTPSTLSGGSSLSVECPNDTLISPNGVFAAGFHPVGDNAFSLAIWFARSSSGPTVVWMANRDQPVNGKRSKLSLLKLGNLVLTDAGQSPIWSTATASASVVQLTLHNTGNLVLTTSDSHILWQSFDSPTNTLLPNQLFTRFTNLVSSRSQTNHSSGFYKLFFDNNNVLTLLYNGPEVSSIYWPDPWLMIWDAGRTTYNSSKIAVLDSAGHFISSDNLQFSSADFGLGPQRRLTLDVDGSLRLYSLDFRTGNWTVTWQSQSDPCRVHGLCGSNSICSYAYDSARRCSCVPGYKMKNISDWSNGCELEHSFSEDDDHKTTIFASVSYTEFYGYEYSVFQNSTLEDCKVKCSESSICEGFLFKFDESSGYYNCYAKSQLLNGKQSPNLRGTLYVKLNVSRESDVLPLSMPVKETKLNCTGNNIRRLDRVYRTRSGNNFFKFLVWVAAAIGLVEMLCSFSVVSFLFWKTRKQPDPAMEGYFLAATAFKKFTYAEMKKATRGFSEEIGRGGHGVVYRGVLPDHRVAAIKRLDKSNEAEAEFLAEINTIGRLNHMNLIEIWGYCSQGKHRILVSEFMEHGSLAENLQSNTLDWEKRFNIAVGMAKGLAYLHEACLEWVLHCDVKPQNILLDTNYEAKVADFGLSKLLYRGGGCRSISFSKIRGTRGYMAPEWAFNLPITSKVDVYSYGIVVLEMVTGRSPGGGASVNGNEEGGGSLVDWVRKKMQEEASWIEGVVDAGKSGGYDAAKMENLIKVAVQCGEEDRDARPTMSKVLQMLLHPQEEIHPKKRSSTMDNKTINLAPWSKVP
ncbi:putative receptor protein kinase ZmPK1 [Diospyros lotus]|uniref:putative receptor protein kinase ZmPK1 n=1 Tax=Diospyros lotus TaxID=55363 RepID=UPI00224D9534|nr:putative receptor protein kinase ZmPK1 [Diospyros lotus]